MFRVTKDEKVFVKCIFFSREKNRIQFSKHVLLFQREGSGATFPKTAFNQT